MTNKQLQKLARCVCTLVVGAIAHTPLIAHAALDDIVLIRGTNTDTVQSSVSVGMMGASPQDICKKVQKFMEANGALVGSVLTSQLAGQFDGPIPDVEAAAKQCAEKDPNLDGSYNMMFTTCSMTTWSDGYVMRWTVPPEAPEATMAIFDPAANQLIAGALLETQLDAVQTFAKGKGTAKINGPSGSEQRQVNIAIGDPYGTYSRTIETFTARKYTFESETQAASVAGAFGPAFLTPKVKSNGNAAIASGVPGHDVISKFYDNFKTVVMPSAGAGTFLGKTIEQMADLADKGMPLRTHQTSRIIMGGMGAGMNESSTSESTVSGIAIYESGASKHNLCGNTVVPDGVTVIDIDQMTASAGQDAQLGQGMAEFQKAMGDLTPEQKAAMQQYGLGNMTAMTNPAATAGTPAAVAGAAPSTKKSSAELTTDNLTQTAQLHLQALGFEVGNTKGNLDTNTIIAISEFQAGKALKVTGAITPQLIGILSAEVDKQR